MNPAPPSLSPDALKHQYSELSLTFRHYSTLRFAVMTVFFAISGALASVAFGATQVSTPVLAGLARVGGLLAALAFFGLEILIERYLRYFVSLANELEQQLGYKVFSGRPQSRVIQTRHATWGMFLVIIGFWVYAIAAM